MDAARALADLTEISSQIGAAVLVEASGEIVATTLREEERSRRIASGAQDLLKAAEELRSGADRLAQIQAATPEGGVFVVRDEERMIVAITGPEPTIGLVFYDLKSCLRNVAAARAGAVETKPRRGARAGEAKDGTP